MKQQFDSFTYRNSYFFSRFKIILKELKDFLKPDNLRRYPVRYRYVFILLCCFVFFLHVYVVVHIYLFFFVAKTGFYVALKKTLVFFGLLLFLEIYYVTWLRGQNFEWPLYCYIAYNEWLPVIKAFDGILDNYRVLALAKYRRYKIRSITLKYFIARLKYILKNVFYLCVKYYRIIIFNLFYHNIFFFSLSFFYWLEYTKIKVFVVDILNVFGFAYPRYVLPRSFKDYWAIPGLTFYVFRFIFKKILFLCVFLKKIFFYPFMDVVCLAMTPHEVFIRRYLTINGYYEAGNFDKNSIIKESLKDPDFRSKYFINLYKESDVEISNFVTIFYVIPFETVKRLFERCCIIMSVKYNLFPTRYNFIVPEALYKFYMSYMFYTNLHNFENTQEYLLFLWKLLRNNYKFNSSNWYINFLVKQRNHFFKYQNFRDQLFFYTTYRGLGLLERDYTLEEFSALGVEDFNRVSKAMRNEFEAVYRSFLPRELIYMADLDYLFPDIGAFNKVSLIRNMFFLNFMTDINCLRHDVFSPFRHVIHKFIRNHWLKMSYYQQMCINDVRDYYQKLELDLLFNSNSYYVEQKEKVTETVRTLADFYFFLLSVATTNVARFKSSYFILKSLIFKKYNIDNTLITVSSRVLNFFVKKQHNEDSYKRILIYEFLLKREASLLQKILSKPIFDRILEEDDLYADYYKAFSYYVERTHEHNIEWCANFHEHFITEYELQAREKLRNSFLALIHAYLIKKKVIIYNFKLKDALFLEAGSVFRLFTHKNYGCGLLLHLNPLDILKLLKYILKGSYIFTYLFFFKKKDVTYLQYKEVFFHDFFLFVFLLPRYLINILVLIISKVRIFFNLFLMLYNVFYSLYLTVVDNRAEHYFNMFLLPFYYWDSWHFNLGYPFLPPQHEKWCMERGITFDIYYNLLALPTIVIWFLGSFYNFIYYKYVASFPLSAVEAKQDGVMVTDEEERLMDGGVFRRLHADKLTKEDIINIVHDELYKKKFKEDRIEEEDFKDIFETKLRNNFAIIDNKFLFKKEFKTLDFVKDEAELYELYNSGRLNLTLKEFEHFEKEETWDTVFEEAWFLQNDFEQTEYMRRNFGDYFYNSPRKLSIQIQERFSVLFSSSPSYDSLLLMETSASSEEYNHYLDYLYVFKYTDYNTNRVINEAHSRMKQYKAEANGKHSSIYY